MNYSWIVAIIFGLALARGSFGEFLLDKLDKGKAFPDKFGKVELIPDKFDKGESFPDKFGKGGEDEFYKPPEYNDHQSNCEKYKIRYHYDSYKGGCVSFKYYSKYFTTKKECEKSCGNGYA